MTHMNLDGTQYERKEMEYGKVIRNENLETRSEEQMEYCSCCGDPMAHAEVLESYLDQSIEQALGICSALSQEYDNGSQIELLAKIAGSLGRAASLTEVARATAEGGING